MNEPALRVRDLSIQFGGIQALTDITFDVPAGGFTAVIGPNGAGKTTLFNCISGFYRGTGTIHVDGRRIDHAPRSARPGAGVARTFQTPILLNEFSTLQNIMLGCHHTTHAGVLGSFLGLPRRGRDERVAGETARSLVEEFGLGRIADVEVAGLPHRDRRLVEIARALASGPRLLLLDEPAAGSQHDEATEMVELVRAHCAPRGIAVVLVEHNVKLVMEAAQDVVVLNFGRVLAHDRPAVVQADPAVADAYLGGAVA